MRTLLAVVVGVFLAWSGVSVTAEDQHEIPVTAGSVSNWLPTAEHEAGQPCQFVTEAFHPRALVIENETHTVIQAVQLEGEIFAHAESGELRCNLDARIPVPDAAFYLVYLDGDFVTAYAPDDFPVPEEWTLLLFLES